LSVARYALRVFGAAIVASSLAASSAQASRTEERVTRNAKRVTRQEAPNRLDRGRFTFVFFPADHPLARGLIDRAVANDSFPGLPRPQHHVLVAIAPDQRRFREWIGPNVPEWGAAVAFPESRRIVMQGRAAGSDAGDPAEVLRHELAHLALHEQLGDLPPRWFDEGYASYAARELERNEVLAANFALVLRGMPTFDELDERFNEGSGGAQAAYALAYRAVVDLAAMDRERGLALVFTRWKETRSLDRAVRAALGMTLASFEREWQDRTRRRYGGLALFSDLTLAGLLVLLIITPLYLVRRRRDRMRMANLRAADAAAAALEQQAILDALLSEPAPASQNGGSTSEAEHRRAEGRGPSAGDEPPERGQPRPRGGDEPQREG